MILPTKQLGPERAILTIGAEILELLSEPKTVSRLWNELLQYPLADRRNEENSTSLPRPLDRGDSNGTMPNMSSGFALGHTMAEQSSTRTVNYDWFVLTLDFLYMLGTIEMDHGKIRRTQR